MEKINYVVAFYGGPRRHYGKHSPILKFAQEHIKFLQQSPEHIDKATFVFNDNPSIGQVDTLKYLTNAELPIKHEIILRKNIGMSYGAWNDVISNTKNQFEYTFTIEDDYIPNVINTMSYFLQKVDKTTIFVASLFTRGHAAISNGLFVNKNSHNPPFNIIDDNSYGGGGLYNQKEYLRKYQNEGLKITDITDIGYTEFSDSQRVINYYGNQTKPLLIKPIM